MSKQYSGEFCLRIRGTEAHFGSVQTGPERSTLPVPSFSAAIGMGRAVLGKTGFILTPQELRLYKRPTLRANGFIEMASASMQTRTPRTRVMAFGNDFSILYRWEIRAKGDEELKLKNMFLKRLENGSWHRSVSLGIRECVAFADWVPDVSTLPEPVDYSEDLGLVYFGQDWNSDKQSFLAPLKIEHGIVRYPTWEYVRKYGIPYHYQPVLT